VPKKLKKVEQVANLIEGCTAKERVAVLNFVLKDLFCALNEDDFLKIQPNNKGGGTIVHGKDILPEPKTRELANEARAILKFDVYNKMLLAMKATACEMMYLKSQTVEDLVFSKAVLYTLSVIDKKMRNIARL
jgi:hypothetical protein